MDQLLDLIGGSSCGQRHTIGLLTYQDVQAGSLEQSDLVSNAEPCKARQPLGKLHDLDDAFSGQLTELVPQPQIQLYPVVCTGVLQGGQAKM